MNLSDLNNIQLKDINVQQVTDNLKSRKDLTAYLVMVGLTLFVMFRIFDAKQNEGRMLKNQIKEMEKKNEVIAEHERMSKELNTFLSGLPAGLSGDNIVDTLTGFAEKHKVQILSFSPARSKTTKLYQHTSVNINVSSPTYKDMVLFVHDIESSPYNFRLENWLGYLGPGGRNSYGNAEDDADLPISSQMEIGAINFIKK